MSTYWYLECLSHDPPIRSDDEVEQHTHGLPAISALVQSRTKAVDESMSYFERHAARFLMQHPICQLQFVSEYGKTEAIVTNHEGQAMAAEHDPVNHPSHYTSDPSGVECLTITRHRTFNIGNAFKYLWRAGLKGGYGGGITSMQVGTGEMSNSAQAKQIEDLRKAIFYINDEIGRLQG